jgi:Fanconi anemia group M protein
VLVSTSVAEEGLDVPEVDLVLFYEPVPTAIRSIQRKGRTGRQTEGKVVVLLANDTRDEAFFWISRRREQEMEEELRKLKGVAEEVEAELDDSQQSLGDFADDDERLEAGLTAFDGGGDSEDGGPEDADRDLEDDNQAASGGAPADADPADGDNAANESSATDGIVATADSDEDVDHVEIVVDQRELDSPIAKGLSRRDAIETRLETLAVGDYVLSDRVAVERKSVADFLDTLTGGDRSMFEQVGDLARAYARPVVLLEGESLYDERNVHPNAIRGALSSLAVDFGASVLRTESEDDTADLLEVIAAREQEVSDRTVSVHGEKSGKTLAEQQEYVVGSVADIGPVTARSLLSAFGTVEAVMTARKEDLMEVDGVGEVTADRLRDVVGSDYE